LAIAAAAQDHAPQPETAPTAQKILELEADKGSAAYKKATSIVLMDEARQIAGLPPRSSRPRLVAKS
jgi:hypothetical protein